MANSEHLTKLGQGVQVWNMWREDNPEIIPDLSDIVLTDVNLDDANLKKVDLTGAKLFNISLKRSCLIQVNLRSAVLFSTNLEKADLHMSDLSGVYFEKTNLSGADLAFAFMGLCIFADVDLSLVEGIELAVHYRPSTIGIDSIYRSNGKIPEVFLRGCGVPDKMIEYAKSLTNTPIQYYSCFISYSHRDEEFAQSLYANLQANSVRCWYAPHDMKIGDKIRPTIDESIRIHDKLLLILSEYSVESDWVEHEAEHALDLEKERKKGVLFPVRLDEAVMDSMTGWASNVRRQRHIGDFTKWKDHDAYKAAFDRLLRDLKA